jgi:hypothetical protein
VIHDGIAQLQRVVSGNAEREPSAFFYELRDGRFGTCHTAEPKAGVFAKRLQAGHHWSDRWTFIPVPPSKECEGPSLQDEALEFCYLTSKGGTGKTKVKSESLNEGSNLESIALV